VSHRRIKIVLAAIGSLAAITVAGASAAMILAGTVHDPSRLLSQEASGKVQKAATIFKDLAGRKMVVIVLPQGRVPDFSAPDSLAEIPIGIVYATMPEDSRPAADRRSGLATARWTYMFPQRLAQKFGMRRSNGGSSSERNIWRRFFPARLHSFLNRGAAGSATNPPSFRAALFWHREFGLFYHIFYRLPDILACAPAR